jgi:hypothetical protein
MPISVNGVFDRYGAEYNISRILDSRTLVDEAAYKAYSPLFFPTTYIMAYAVCFALTTALLVHTILYYGPTMLRTARDIKTAQTDIHAKLMLAYREVPAWWFLATLTVFAAMSIALVEVGDQYALSGLQLN